MNEFGPGPTSFITSKHTQLSPVGDGVGVTAGVPVCVGVEVGVGVTPGPGGAAAKTKTYPASDVVML